MKRLPTETRPPAAEAAGENHVSKRPMAPVRLLDASEAARTASQLAAKAAAQTGGTPAWGAKPAQPQGTTGDRRLPFPDALACTEADIGRRGAILSSVISPKRLSNSAVASAIVPARTALTFFSTKQSG